MPNIQRRHLLTLATGAALAAPWVGARSADAPVLKVGVTTGPHEQVFEVVKRIADRDHGLKVQLVAFTDYSRPNAALDAGDLDANSFQHRPFLAAQVRTRGYKVVGFGRTWIGPMAIYSKKVKRFADLAPGAQIAIPNDPANESRVLLLLQKSGAIKLKTGIDPIAGINATPRDIVENPKNFRFVELEAAQLPRTLDDTDASAINADYAVKAGLNSVRDSLLREDKDGPYACLIAVREQDQEKPWVQQLVKSYQNDEVRQFILTKFDGAVLPAF